MAYKTVLSFILAVIFLAGCATLSTPDTQSVLQPQGNSPDPTPTIFSGWQEQFDLSNCTMISTGENPYFILEPGFQLTLEGGNEVLVITVLDETLEVEGIGTRVIEEREWRNDQLIEVSRNFFAMCEETKDVYYFGEEVDMYQGGVLSSHSGAWRSGEGNAMFGLIMPGDPKVGMKYYQEIAPGVAMDRAEIISLDDTIGTPAGEFPNSLKTKEGTALNLLEVEYKAYAPGIGLIQDANLRLTGHGLVENN